MSDQTAIYRERGTGPITWAMNSLFEHLLGPREGDGSLGVALVTQPPGIATPLHRHSNESEAFFMVDGTMTYRAGEEYFDMAAGDFVWLPQGLPHAFRITGRAPAKMLALTCPGGLLELYEEVGVPAQERRLPDGDGRPLPEEIGRWNEIGPRFGLQVLGPPIPEPSPQA